MKDQQTPIACIPELKSKRAWSTTFKLPNSLCFLFNKDILSRLTELTLVSNKHF
eukprot:GAHX01001633.1.p2 GENE.GAHX01001633.1~~GAHX01001633.1.p2  ORF type:complete len:54 (+),score=6.94 GAHX01001633.1:423-584(+)